MLFNMAVWFTTHHTTFLDQLCIKFVNIDMEVPRTYNRKYCQYVLARETCIKPNLWHGRSNMSECNISMMSKYSMRETSPTTLIKYEKVIVRRLFQTRPNKLVETCTNSLCIVRKKVRNNRYQVMWKIMHWMCNILLQWRDIILINR